MICEQHPMWCTRQHRPDANPNRLTHENVLDFTTNRRYKKRLIAYPHRDATANLYVQGIPTLDKDTIVLCLSEAETRALGERLIEIADAALVEQAIHMAPRSGVPA